MNPLRASASSLPGSPIASPIMPTAAGHQHYRPHHSHKRSSLSGSPARRRSGSTTSLTSVSTIGSSIGTSTAGLADRRGGEGYGDYESIAGNNGEVAGVGSTGGSNRGLTLAEMLAQGPPEGPPPERNTSSAFRFGFMGGGAAAKLKKEKEKQAKLEKKERKAREKEANRLLASHNNSGGGGGGHGGSGSGSGSGSAIYLPSNSSTSNLSVLTAGKEPGGTSQYLRDQHKERIHSSASSSYSATGSSDHGSSGGVTLGIFTGACLFNGCPHQSKTCPLHNKKYRKKLEEFKRLEESMRQEEYPGVDRGGDSSPANTVVSTGELSTTEDMPGPFLAAGPRSGLGVSLPVPPPPPLSPPPASAGGSIVTKNSASTSKTASSTTSCGTKGSQALKRVGNGLSSKSMVSLSRDVFDGLGSTLQVVSNKNRLQEKRDRESSPLKISDPFVAPLPMKSSLSSSSTTSSSPRTYSPINDNNHRKRSPSVNAIEEALKVSQARAIFPLSRDTDPSQPVLQESREPILYRPPSVIESAPLLLPRSRIRDSQLYAPLPSFHPLAPPPPAHQQQKKQKEREKEEKKEREREKEREKEREREREKEKEKESKNKKTKNKEKPSEGVPLRMGFLDFGQKQDGFVFIPNHHRTMQSLQQAPNAPLDVANILHAQELEYQQEQLQHEQQQQRYHQHQAFNASVSRHIISPNEITLVIEQEAEEMKKRQETMRLLREQEQLEQQRLQALEDEEAAAAAASGTLSPPSTQRRKKSICSLPIDLPVEGLSLVDVAATPATPQGPRVSGILNNNVPVSAGPSNGGTHTTPVVPASPSSSAPWMPSIPPQLPTGPRLPPGSRSQSFTAGTSGSSPDARARPQGGDYFSPHEHQHQHQHQHHHSPSMRFGEGEMRQSSSVVPSSDYKMRSLPPPKRRQQDVPTVQGPDHYGNQSGQPSSPVRPPLHHQPHQFQHQHPHPHHHFHQQYHPHGTEPHMPGSAYSRGAADMTGVHSGEHVLSYFCQIGQNDALSPAVSQGSHSSSMSPALTPSSISTVETSKTFGTPASPSSITTDPSPTSTLRRTGTGSSSASGSMHHQQPLSPFTDRRSSAGSSSTTTRVFMDHHSSNVPPVPPVPDHHHALIGAMGGGMPAGGGGGGGLMRARAGSETGAGGSSSSSYLQHYHHHGSSRPPLTMTLSGGRSNSSNSSSGSNQMHFTPTFGTKTHTGGVPYQFPDLTLTPALSLPSPLPLPPPPLSPSARQQLMETRPIVLYSPTRMNAYQFPAPRPGMSPLDQGRRDGETRGEEEDEEEKEEEEEDDDDDDEEEEDEGDHEHEEEQAKEGSMGASSGRGQFSTDEPQPQPQPRPRTRNGRHSLDKQKRISFIRKGSGCSTLLGEDDEEGRSSQDDDGSDCILSSQEDLSDDDDDDDDHCGVGDTTSATRRSSSSSCASSSSHRQHHRQRRRQKQQQQQQQQRRHRRSYQAKRGGGGGQQDDGSRRGSACSSHSERSATHLGARRMSEGCGGYSSSASLSSALSPPLTPMMEHHGLRKLSLFTAAFNGRPPPPLMTMASVGSSSLSQVETSHASESEDEEVEQPQQQDEQEDEEEEKEEEKEEEGEVMVKEKEEAQDVEEPLPPSVLPSEDVELEAGGVMMSLSPMVVVTNDANANVDVVVPTTTTTTTTTSLPPLVPLSPPPVSTPPPIPPMSPTRLATASGLASPPAIPPRSPRRQGTASSRP
ncbi:hypothetical protein DFQ27_003162 [Actinomortierella ambigua]|uniref:Uncharacterized protein n=1 Tax=Actinomortierella ambigua TaxID=1343610 RepID=A0A9P6Q5F4_9FUNG|nr:hypothetical protein DFQ27_003162 [Actinomortierella ambigua]